LKSKVELKETDACFDFMEGDWSKLLNLLEIVIDGSMRPTVITDEKGLEIAQQKVAL